MPDFILDDIKELLLKEKGDPKILERIQRAAEQGEVISVYEREYIKELTEKYLRPKKETTTTPEVQPEPEKITTKPNVSQQIPQERKKPIFESKSSPRTTKIAFGIGAIALALILVIGISFSGIDVSTSPPPSTPTNTQSLSKLSVETDGSSYDLGDIISISGNSKSKGNVDLSIKNSDGVLIWSESVAVKDIGIFSTLVIAGGSGWDSSGKYILEAENDDDAIQITFNFKK